MKITDTMGNLNQAGSTTQKAKSNPQDSFENALNQQLSTTKNKPAHSKAVFTANRTAMMELTTQINASGAISVNNTQDTINRVGAALDLLEQYQRALNDPGSSLKGLAPTVQKMEKEADTLASLIPSMTGDQEGSELLDKVASLMKVETIKFKRGDYL